MTSSTSVVPTVEPTISRLPTFSPSTRKPSLIPTYKPTRSPTQIPTKTSSPTYAYYYYYYYYYYSNSTNITTPSNPSTIKPTRKPTTMAIPTFEPTIILSPAPILDFTATLTIESILFNRYLDNHCQDALIKASADVMSIPNTYIAYNGFSYRRFLLSEGTLDLNFDFGLIANNEIRMTIPLEGSYSQYVSNPTVLYNALTNKMSSAVTNGNYTIQFRKWAKTNSARKLFYTNITSASFTPFTILTQTPAKVSSSTNTENMTVVWVIIGIVIPILIIALVFYCWNTKKLCFNKSKGGEYSGNILNPKTDVGFELIAHHPDQSSEVRWERNMYVNAMAASPSQVKVEVENTHQDDNDE